MPIFEYRAMDNKGRVVNGSLNAADPEALAEILRDQQLFLIEGRPREENRRAYQNQQPQQKTAVEAKPAAAKAKEPAPHLPRSSDSVALKAVAAFTNELGIMVRTALPILEALEGLAKQQPDPTFKSVLFDIAKSVREGKSLSQSFSRYPKIFNEIYLSLMEAGEASGHLSTMLDRIVAHLNFQIELRAKVRGALLYPTIVIITSIAVVSFLVLFILPTFADVFAQLGVELPLPTRILLAISAHARHWWYVYVMGAAGGWYLFTRWLANPTNVKIFDAFQLKLPIVGPVVKAIAITRVLRTLSSLLSSGVPILQSLHLASASAGNLIFSDLFNQVYRSASEGHGLATALTASPYFPQSVSNMISNAEKTGTLPEVLNQVALYYEKETDNTLKNLFAAIEPIFVVFLGIMVGGIAVSILLPIFDIGTHIE